jgi:hypothetical protein
MLKADLPVGLLWDVAERYAPSPVDGALRHPNASENFDLIRKAIIDITEDRQEALLRTMAAQSPKTGGTRSALVALLEKHCGTRKVERDPWQSPREYGRWSSW